MIIQKTARHNKGTSCHCLWAYLSFL